MIMRLIELLVLFIVLLWLNFHIKYIENKLDIVIELLKKKKNKK